MVKKCARYKIGFGRIATEDGSVLMLLFLTAAVIFAGIFVRLNVLQWSFVMLLTLVFLFTGIYRSAARLLTCYDDTISIDQAVRIRAMGNIIVMVTAGFTLFSYLIIFVPKINQLL